MKKLFTSIAVVAVVALATIGATRAYFSDTETSTGNLFTAGILDLKLNGADENVSYTYTNMRPGSQPNMRYRLRNVGSIAGFLDIREITVTSMENACLEPEISSGDVSCGTGINGGELDEVLNLRLMLDNNCDGWLQTGDIVLFEGYAKDIANLYDSNIRIPAGGEVCINTLINWWNTSMDNLAQSDDMTFNMSFELSQEE